MMQLPLQYLHQKIATELDGNDCGDKVKFVKDLNYNIWFLGVICEISWKKKLKNMWKNILLCLR